MKETRFKGNKTTELVLVVANGWVATAVGHALHLRRGNFRPQGLGRIASCILGLAGEAASDVRRQRRSHHLQTLVGTGSGKNTRPPASVIGQYSMIHNQCSQLFRLLPCTLLPNSEWETTHRTPVVIGSCPLCWNALLRRLCCARNRRRQSTRLCSLYISVD